MSGVDVPLVVCVSADLAVRERVLRRMEDLGPLVICADLAELRSMLFADPPTGIDQAGTGADHNHRSFGTGDADGEDGYRPVTEHLAPVPVRLGDLVIDSAEHEVTWRGKPLALTRLERELLARLASPPLRVWSYERLFSSVWGGAYLGDTAILHSAMKRLRRKLRGIEAGPQVQTVRGVGYRLASGGLALSGFAARRFAPNRGDVPARVTMSP